MGEDGIWMVINHEEQYSIWPADRDVPRDWRPVYPKGTKEGCVQYFIEKVWTDMQPVVINPFRD